LQRYADQINFRTQSNMGEACAVNEGLRMARGEYILILSADDPLLTGTLLDEAIEILQSREDIAAVYPDWNLIDSQGHTISTKILENYSDEIMIGKCKTLPGPGTVFRKDMALQINGRSSNWRFVSDYDFWLRLSRIGTIVRIPKVLAQWRYHESSASVANRNLEMAKERINVIESFLSNHRISTKLSRSALGNAYYMAARLSFFDSRIKGRTLLFKAIIKNRKIPSESRVFVILYLLLLPISRIIVKLIPKSKIRELGA